MSSYPPEANTHRTGPLTPAETRRALRTSMIAWGLFGSAYLGLVTGAPYVTFAREKLHVSTFMFGLLSSLPYLGVLAQLLGSYWVERTRRRRSLVMTVSTMGRSIYLLVAALPWVIPSQWSGARIGAFVGLILLSSALLNLGSPAGFSWFADIVPESMRARYLSRRAALSTTTIVIVSTIASRIVDQDARFLVFTVLFGLGAVLGVVDVLFYCLRVREPQMAPHEGPPWRMRQVIVTPLRDGPFRGYLVYAFSESFMNGIIGPFYWLMALEYLKIGAFWSNTYVMMMPMVFTALALPLWGGMCERFGAKPLLRLGTLVTLVYPVMWVLATPAHYHLLLATPAIIGGLFGAAIYTSDLTMMYALTPQANRSAYMAMLMLASNLGWAVSPTIGGAIAQALKPVEVHAAGLTFTNLHLLMFISIGVALVHVLLIIPRLPEPNAAPTRAVIAHLLRRPLEALLGPAVRPPVSEPESE